MKSKNILIAMFVIFAILPLVSSLPLPKYATYSDCNTTYTTAGGYAHASNCQYGSDGNWDTSTGNGYSEVGTGGFVYDYHFSQISSNLKVGVAFQQVNGGTVNLKIQCYNSTGWNTINQSTASLTDGAVYLRYSNVPTGCFVGNNLRLQVNTDDSDGDWGIKVKEIFFSDMDVITSTSEYACDSPWLVGSCSSGSDGDWTTKVGALDSTYEFNYTIPNYQTLGKLYYASYTDSYGNPSSIAGYNVTCDGELIAYNFYDVLQNNFDWFYGEIPASCYADGEVSLRFTHNDVLQSENIYDSVLYSESVLPTPLMSIAYPQNTTYTTNISELNYSILNYSTTYGWCYQETANVSTACGGLGTGSYGVGGDPLDNGLGFFIDGNWSNYAFCDSGTCLVYINYSKPDGAIDAKWRLGWNNTQTAINDYSIHSSCFSLNPIQLQISANGGSTISNLYCRNSTDWYNFGTIGASYGNYIREEGIDWFLSNPLVCSYSTNGGETNNSMTCGNNVTGLSSSLGSNTWQTNNLGNYYFEGITSSPIEYSCNLGNCLNGVDGYSDTYTAYFNGLGYYFYANFTIPSTTTSATFVINMYHQEYSRGNVSCYTGTSWFPLTIWDNYYPQPYYEERLALPSSCYSTNKVMIKVLGSYGSDIFNYRDGKVEYTYTETTSDLDSIYFSYELPPPEPIPNATTTNVTASSCYTTNDTTCPSFIDGNLTNPFYQPSGVDLFASYNVTLIFDIPSTDTFGYANLYFTTMSDDTAYLDLFCLNSSGAMQNIYSQIEGDWYYNYTTQSTPASWQYGKKSIPEQCFVDNKLNVTFSFRNFNGGNFYENYLEYYSALTPEPTPSPTPTNPNQGIIDNILILIPLGIAVIMGLLILMIYNGEMKLGDKAIVTIAGTIVIAAVIIGIGAMVLLKLGAMG